MTFFVLMFISHLAFRLLVIFIIGTYFQLLQRNLQAVKKRPKYAVMPFAKKNAKATPACFGARTGLVSF
jgi:hypothetical protein